MFMPYEAFQKHRPLGSRVLHGNAVKTVAMKIFSVAHFDLRLCTVSIDLGRTINDFILRSNDDRCDLLFAGDREVIRKRRREDGVASSQRSAAIDSTRRWTGLLPTSTKSCLDLNAIGLSSG